MYKSLLSVKKISFSESSSSQNLKLSSRFLSLLFFFKGGNTIGKHPPSPSTSPQKVEVAKVVVLTGEKKDPTLMKAHGELFSIYIMESL